jgi:uncharacterized protein
VGAVCDNGGRRAGYGVLPPAQREIVQEMITLPLFVRFAVMYMDQPIEIDHPWAALCLGGAVYFVFRS